MCILGRFDASLRPVGTGGNDTVPVSADGVPDTHALQMLVECRNGHFGSCSASTAFSQACSVLQQKHFGAPVEEWKRQAVRSAEGTQIFCAVIASAT